MTTPDCPLGGRCDHACEDTCQGWADRARVIADGQEAPMEPAEVT